MTNSDHFEDFAPTPFAPPPATYPDEYKDGMRGRWFVVGAGVLWTDDLVSLGLDTTNAVDWAQVTALRAALRAQFALGTPVTQLFNELQAELNPDEWFEGELGAAGLVAS